MQITIKALQGEVPTDAHDYTHEKVGRLTRFGNGLIAATLNLSERASKDASKSHLAEIVIHAPGQILRVQEAGKTFEAAVDTASEKLKQQLKKLKTKRLDKSRDHPGVGDIIDAEFKATEKLKFIFQSSIANIFNTPHYTFPNANISQPGQVGSLFAHPGGGAPREKSAFREITNRLRIEF